ncbi:MAG: hypothetical protein AAFX08_08815 [Pseudomonadota bacterium]
MGDLIGSLYDWLQNIDFQLNLAAEFVGVVLSIPLSIWIASLLDRRVERRRQKGALLAVVRVSQHELHYFARDFPTKMMEEGASYPKTSVGVFRTTKQSVVNAELAIRDIISNAQAQLSGQIDTNLLQTMFRLRYQWRTLTEFLVFEDAYFLHNVAEGKSSDEMISMRIEGIRNVIEWIHRHNIEIANLVSAKAAREVERDEPSLETASLRQIISTILEYRIKQIGEEIRW